MSRDTLIREAQTLPIISSHEHHREDALHRSLDLDGVLANSYVNWCLPVPKPTREERERYLDEIRYNSYFVWLQKALQDIYAFDAPINADNWDELSRRISDAHRAPDHHLRILKEHCRYLAAVQDAYWDPGSDMGHPEMFKPAFRIDAFFHGFHADSPDNNGVNPHTEYAFAPTSFAEFLADMERIIRDRRERSVALKCAIAYERTLDMNDCDYAAAERAFGKSPDAITPAERKAFGDVVFNRICEIATELDLPIQVHVGLARISGSSPMLFEPVIARHPRCRFVLFHGGFPWYHQIAGLAHNYANVVIDLCWLPIISTSAAVSALHEYIDVARSSSRITWGGDNWTSEESYGASLAFRHVLAKVLEEKVDSGAFGWREAIRLAEKIASENNRRIYRLA